MIKLKELRMSYDKIFHKVADSFFLSFDIEELMNNFTEISMDPLASKRGSHRFYKNPEGMFTWQYFPLNNTISINFSKTFPKEAEEIVCKLKILKEKILESNIESYVVEKLKHHEIDPERITIFKLNSEDTVDPHVDNSRTAVINIGLKNTNTHHVLIGRTPLASFWKNNHETFIVEDGQVYLLDVRYMHGVVPRKENRDKKTRYILSYNLDIIPDTL
jgi:hypothetical protein